MSTSLLPLVQVQLYRYGLPAIFALGIIGNAFVVILFRLRRHNSCASYLLWAAVGNTAYLTFNTPLLVYNLDHADPAANSLAFCKLRFYLSHVSIQLPRYFMVLACVDRFAVSANNARFRFITRQSVTRWIKAITIIFWFLFPIHLLIFVTINDGRCSQFGIYSVVYQVYFMIFVCMIPPVSMAVLGFFTYRNLRLLHGRVQPVGNIRAGNPGNITIHRRDQELVSMVLAEVIVYVVTMFSYPFINLEVTFTNLMGVEKSPARVQIENFFIAISVLLLYLNCIVAFYTYLTVSTAFRKDFKQLFTQWWHRVIQPGDANERQRTGQVGPVP